MAEKINELTTGPLRTPEDQRRAIEAMLRKINEIVRRLNELLPP